MTPMHAAGQQQSCVRQHTPNGQQMRGSNTQLQGAPGQGRPAAGPQHFRNGDIRRAFTGAAMQGKPGNGKPPAQVQHVWEVLD